MIKYITMAGAFALYLTAAGQNVGIGTNTPAARLHVADSAVVFSAPGVIPQQTGKTPVEGAGRRMMWYPQKAAFRVGYISDDSWDNQNIGNFSFAAGSDVKASATGSVAIGTGLAAEGFSSVVIGSSSRAGYLYGLAIGYLAEANAAYGVAIGAGPQVTMPYGVAIGYLAKAGGQYSLAASRYATANGDYSVAIGTAATAQANNAFAIGNTNTASGQNAFSIGNGATASGLRSFALGNSTVASGPYSTAMGNYVSTSNYEGSFALGDNSTTTVMESFVANGFRARFAGGYRLFTTSAVTIGSFLNAGANAWAALSDQRLKENFLPVDGEAFLQRIAGMPLTTWNYKGQDVKTMRHYGPMAQDFYAAFGKDALGEIGCDTLINQQDFLGVNLIAIQALEKRTQRLGQMEAQLKNLEKENAWFREKLNVLMKTVQSLTGTTTLTQ